MKSMSTQTKMNYEVDDTWGERIVLAGIGDVGGIGIDQNDNAYVFNRGPDPMIVLDPDGTVIARWGHDLFEQAHGVQMGPDETLYLTDSGNHTLTRCTLEGKVLLRIGLPGVKSEYMSGKPFNRCTHSALSPEGDIYISDGYGNAAVHKYTSSGSHLFSWGGPGVEPGNFNIPHNIACDEDGLVYVADRESHRVQVFDGNGQYITQWNNLHRPCAFFYDSQRSQFIVGEAGPGMPINLHMPRLGSRLVFLDSEGVIQSTWGSQKIGEGPDEFLAPHGVAVDSVGRLYLGEVSRIAWPDYFAEPVPEHLRTIRRLLPGI